MTVIALPEFLYYAAWDTANQQFVSGDVANHTIQLAIGGAAPKTPDNQPEAAGIGVYRVQLSPTERVGEQVALSGSSTTENVIIQPVSGAADARLAGMTFPDPETPTVANYIADAHAILSQHIADVGAATIGHGDGDGGWGAVADTSGLATSQQLLSSLADLQAHGDENWTTWDGSVSVMDANVVQWNGVTEPVAEWTKQTLSIKSGVLVDAQTTPTATEFSTNLTEQATDHWKNRSVIMLTGTLQYQASVITGYVFAGGKGVITVAGFTSAPSEGDELLIV